jgi:glyoxylase-like metal-dependent hydrolase (beta-lactamase superfamily II)
MRPAKFLLLAAAVATATFAASARPGVEAAGAAQARPAQAAPALRLYVFDGGTLGSDPARYNLTKEDVGVTDLSVAAYLVVHPKGVLLWDTGAITDSAWKPTGGPVEQQLMLGDGRGRRVVLTKSLQQQLTASGFAPKDVTHLALSHQHWDHTANANLFSNATWLVRQVERDAMFGPKPNPTARPETYSQLKGARTTILMQPEHDVFGDGTVIVKLAPGHTEGHQVLYVKLPKTGGVLLSGDLYHYVQERTMDRYPNFEVNEAQTRAARRDVEAFIKQTGAKLWIQHDLTAHNALKKAPAYYD